MDAGGDVAAAAAAAAAAVAAALDSDLCTAAATSRGTEELLDERAAALSPAAEQSAEEEGGDGDTIAARTRTKLSLVDVPIDTLEAYLPDAVEPILGEEQDREYQRFLSSLLPHEQENLSFLDEEDEEYEPEDEDEDDAEVASDNAKERMTVKISKKELTELLWDSSRLGLSLLGAAPAGAPNGQLLAAAASAASDFTGGGGAPAFSGFNLHGGAGTGANALQNGAFPPPPALGGYPFAAAAASNAPAPMFFPQQMMIPPSLRFLRPGDGTQPAQDLHGTITQEQCIQLASQMHKHVQLLLQNLHLFGSAAKEVSGEADEAGGGASGAPAKAQSLRAALNECKTMVKELQTRGVKAQQCKGALLSKLNPGASFATSKTQQELMGSRRVTRSLTAAHAAVAHPSMFELVGSYSLDELTAKFEHDLSLQERNKTIQEQLLEIDKHLLVTKKKNPKKPFTVSEDNLLAHGVKRFALHADSWSQIEKNFLPGKTTTVIQRRYRYLASNKTGMSAVKEYHSQFPKRRDSSWILEEDLRIARGLIEFHNDNRRFARVGMNYLPHRSRFEIRKRWERIRLRFYPVVAAWNPEIDDASIDFTVLVKDLLEDKLREQVKEQSMKILEGKAQQSRNTNSTDASRNDELARQRTPGGKGTLIAPAPAPTKPGAVSGSTIQRADEEMKQDATLAESAAAGGGGASSARGESRRERELLSLTTSLCRTKNLHPALFFTSWALINPAILLGRTCEHNWPSFIEEMSAQHKEQQPSSTSEAAAPMSAETESLGTSSAVDVGIPGASSPTAGEALSSEPLVLPTTPNRSYDSEPSTANTSAVLEDEEEDDSDYEHDELVSSEGENGSDSEFEQLELSDDDDEEDDEEDDEDDDDFDYEELEDSDEYEDDWEEEREARDDSVRLVTPRKPSPVALRRVSTPRARSAATPSAAQAQSQQQQQPSPPVRHPLRLQNLQKPGNERMKRALAALERRIIGKSVHSPAGGGHSNSAIAPAARPSGEKKRISRVSLETTQSTGPTRAYGSPLRDDVAIAPTAVEEHKQNDKDREEDSYVPDFDLETSEVLSSGDDSFEREELSGDDSSNEEAGNENAYNDFEMPEDGEQDAEWYRPGATDADDVAALAALAARQQQQLQRGDVWTPNKKIKLVRSDDAVCPACGRRGSCGCSAGM